MLELWRVRIGRIGVVAWGLELALAELAQVRRMAARRRR